MYFIEYLCKTYHLSNWAPLSEDLKAHLINGRILSGCNELHKFLTKVPNTIACIFLKHVIIVSFLRI